MKSLFTLCLVLLWALPVYAQEVRLIGRPDLAVKFAATDIRTLQAADPEKAAHCFYVWIRDPQDKELDSVYDFVLNMAVSRAPVLLRADRVRGPHGILLRIDRRAWLPSPELRADFNKVISSYLDPCFYVDAGKSVGAVESVSFIDSTEAQISALFAEQHPQLVFKSIGERDANTNRIKVVTEPYVVDGKQYTAAWVVDPLVDTPVASGTIFGPAIQSVAAEDIQTLTSITGLTVPIVEAERFLVFSLRTLEGGLYYKLQGLIDGNGKRLSQTEWLKTFGADEALADALGGREFVGMWNSAVTGKARRVSFFYGTSTRPSTGLPLIVVTQDNFDETNATELHPVYSLLDSKFDATEILVTRPNGMIAYGLFSGEGVLQDAAPDNLVHDHTVPKPYTSRLESAISCIRCHAPHDQWQPVKNHVQSLLRGMKDGSQKLSVIGDAAASGLNVEELNVKLALLYGGNIETALQMARDRFESACAKLTDERREQTDYAKWMAQVVSDRFAAYRYRTVDPREALRTLGIDAPAEKADAIFAQLVPATAPDNGPALFDVALFTLRLHVDDPEISILREDWERVFPATLAYSMQYGQLPTQEENPNANDPNP